jgi:hypothetical protein
VLEAYAQVEEVPPSLVFRVATLDEVRQQIEEDLIGRAKAAFGEEEDLERRLRPTIDGAAASSFVRFDARSNSILVVTENLERAAMALDEPGFLSARCLRGLLLHEMGHALAEAKATGHEDALAWVDGAMRRLAANAGGTGAGSGRRAARRDRPAPRRMKADAVLRPPAATGSRP